LGDTQVLGGVKQRRRGDKSGGDPYNSIRDATEHASWYNCHSLYAAGSPPSSLPGLDNHPYHSADVRVSRPLALFGALLFQTCEASYLRSKERSVVLNVSELRGCKGPLPGTSCMPVSSLFVATAELKLDKGPDQARAASRIDPTLQRALQQLLQKTTDCTRLCDGNRDYEALERSQDHGANKAVPQGAEYPATWLEGSCTLQAGTVTLSTNDTVYRPAPRLETRRPVAKPRPKTKSGPTSTVDRTSPDLADVMVEASASPTLKSTQTRPTMPPKPKRRPNTDIYGQASGGRQALTSSTTEGRAHSAAGPDLVYGSDRTASKSALDAGTPPAPAEKTSHSTTRQGRDTTTNRRVRPAQGRPPLPPRVPKSIWFDFDDDPTGPTSPVLPAAAPAKRKRASRRQMFQTVLRISAVNRAADDATRAEVTLDLTENAVVQSAASTPGPGKYRLTTPVGTLECWPVAAPARLEAPPRYACDIGNRAGLTATRMLNTVLSVTGSREHPPPPRGYAAALVSHLVIECPRCCLQCTGDPTRIQHLRLVHRAWTLDLIHVYQKPFNFHPKAAQDAKQIRAEIWSVLEAQLKRIPKRHTLLPVGDFNCPLKTYPQAGPRIQTGGCTMPPDQARLQALVEDYGLAHLNSWCKAAGPTYVHAKGAGLIDHVLMRASQVDNRAKQAKPVDLALAAWRLGGKHLPIQASLPVVPFHSLNHPAKPKRTWNHWEVVQLCKCPNDSRVETLRFLIQQELHKAVDIASLNQLLINCATKVFPPVKGQQRLAAWQQPCMSLGIKGMWQARRQWKHLAQTQPDQVLRISRAHQVFKQAHKAFKHAGKACRKQWFYDKIDELQAAAGRGDTRSLFAGIRTVAPGGQAAPSSQQLSLPGPQADTPAQVSDVIRWCRVGIAIKIRSTKTDTGISVSVKYLVSVPSFVCDTTAPMASFAEAMDMDEQEKMFFGHLGPVKREPRMSDASATPLTLGPAKRQRLEPQDRSKGKGGKGKNKGKGKGHPPPGRSSPSGGYPQSQAWGYSNGSGEELSTPWAGDRTALLLSSEQVLTHLRQDMMLYLFVRSGEKGMIPVMCQAADKWRQLKEESPEKLQMSLKLAMFKQLLISLYERLTTTQQDAQAMAHAKSLGWLDEDQSWRILRWNPAQQSLEVDQSCQPVPTKDLLDQITNVRKAINEDSLLRFKSLRRLSSDVTAEWIQFQIAISLRMEAAPLWTTLKSWIGQSSWHTLGCRMRRDRPTYDSLTAGNTGACYTMGGTGHDRHRHSRVGLGYPAIATHLASTCGGPPLSSEAD
ncbi:unnamed protein product, partial [Symbiodinium microadriaticum]